MKKTFILEDLGCANCAAKMEDAISKIDGVNSAKINFVMSKLTIDADSTRLDSILDEAQKICSRIEPDVVIVH